MEPRSLERGAVNAPEQEEQFDIAAAAETVDSAIEGVVTAIAESERGATTQRALEAATDVAAGAGDAEAGKAAWMAVAEARAAA